MSVVNTTTTTKTTTNTPAVSANGVNSRVAIKFLLSNSLAGSLIGSGGKTIKELMALTDTKIHVSNLDEPFPGSSDRVVLISGTQAGICLAQALVWEMIGAMAKAAGDVRNVDWNPQTCLENRGANEDIEVTARFTIPAAAGGAVVGRGGAVIQQIATETGANVSLTGKEEALLTKERIVTVRGHVSQCIAATDRVVETLCSLPEIPVFENRGTKYSAAPQLAQLGIQPAAKRRKSSHPEMVVMAGAIPDTTITLHIPEEHVGTILGRQGTILKEICALSGAKIHVSGRGEYAPGTSNRIVTVSGPPASTQAAHIFLTQRLQVSASAPRRPL